VSDNTGPLSGITVVDMTQVMAGPFCTMILADLGADVIKIETPGTGDQSRRSWGQQWRAEDSAGFMALNRNKRSASIDLKSPQGLRQMYDIVRTADVVVENFRPGVTQRLKVSYEHLATVKPDVIYASISGFGQTGPYSARGGYDLIAQGMSGVMSVMGPEGDDRPVKSAIPLGDLGAGLFCAIGILAAYVARERGEGGQRIDTSLFEAALAMSVWESAEYWSTGHVPGRLGSANRMSAPYQALQARDGFLTVGANNQRLWQLLCDVLGCPELIADERFSTNDRRMRHRPALIAQLEECLAAADVATWVKRLEEAGVPAGPVLDYAQVLDGDPQVTAREMVIEMDHPEAGPLKALGFPVKLSRTPASIRRPPPLLGEHTAVVLAEARGAPRANAGADEEQRQ
jgi:crotonobetainyl-CoA:carnitine CoA-transferase CaiB-like acyl-CoA transferase